MKKTLYDYPRRGICDGRQVIADLLFGEIDTYWVWDPTSTKEGDIFFVHANEIQFESVVRSSLTAYLLLRV